MLNINISHFLEQNQLPGEYALLAERWYTQLIEEIVRHCNSAQSPVIIGINGAQGSGKSTLAAFLVYVLQNQYELNAVQLSLDDFYYTRQQREALGKQIHPLLATRGVPGTHDVSLAIQTIQALQRQQFPVRLSRFNKACDDRYPAEESEVITHPVDVIVLEGWCLGSLPEDPHTLIQPINDLEMANDADGRWRNYVNEQLAQLYPPLFAMIDIWVMLKAPSFNCVYQWRLEQEEKLRQKHPHANARQIMDNAAIARFIKLYQRITQNTLKTLPSHVHFLYELNEKRQITTMAARSTLPHKPQWLIFTDMDGSLLDHHSYRFDEAVPMLNVLEQNHIPVIPVTSKTLAEVELIRDTLHNQHPFIVENGAAVLIPVGYFTQQPADCLIKGKYWIKEFVEPRQRWQLLIEQIAPKYKGEFQTFTQAGIDGIIALTGLNVHAAARAARREYGEPVCWHGNGKLKNQFINELREHGAHILEGGRFIHVSGDCDKGRALLWLRAVFCQQFAQQSVLTLAIGDSHNDVAMLEQADYALIIRSPAHPAPSVQRISNLYVSDHPGPQGWAQSVSQILDIKP